MSMHKIPLTPLEEEGLRLHGLPIGRPSQRSDTFRQGMAWAIKAAQNPPQSISSIPPDCRACANRGRVNGLSQESYCDSCVYEGRGWRQNHFVDARKMVDAVKRRCEACAILPCSCK